MGPVKVDGIVEAVRYTSEGKIAVARSYERRGAVWSDLVLLNRNELVERLKKGKRFATGHRKTYVGSVFETGSPIHYRGDFIVSDGQAAGRDLLAGVPIF